MSTWTFTNIKGQGHSLTFVQGHSDSIFSNFFCSETARSIEAKFHMEPPWNVRNKNLFKCSRSHIWWKSSKIFFFGTKRPMSLKLGIQHRVLEWYQCFHMMTLGWLSPFLWRGQICFWILLHGWKLIQHWVLIVLIHHILSTQVSDTGPMVLWFNFLLIFCKWKQWIQQE